MALKALEKANFADQPSLESDIQNRPRHQQAADLEGAEFLSSRVDDIHKLLSENTLLGPT